MTSSKHLPTCHYIHRFIHRSLVLKTSSNTGQMPGTTAEGNQGNVVKSEVWRNPIMEDEHDPFFCKSQRRRKLQYLISLIFKYESFDSVQSVKSCSVAGRGFDNPLTVPVQGWKFSYPPYQDTALLYSNLNKNLDLSPISSPYSCQA